MKTITALTRALILSGCATTKTREEWSKENFPEICECYDLEELCGKPKRKWKYETFMDYIEANQDQMNLITAKDAFSAAREEI